MNKKELEKKIKDKQQKIKTEKEKLQDLKTMRDYEGDDEVITSQEALELLQDDSDRKTYWTGLPTLDKLIDGLEGGDLVVISAPTKHGKTEMCKTLTMNFADKDINSLWFSYELRQRSFLKGFGKELPTFTLPKELKTSSTDWIERKIVEAKAKYGAKMVFIDHLHYLVSLDQTQGRNFSLLIGAIMRELKKIAVRWNVTIFLIAHTRKTSFDKEPQLSDIRDSSFISQESDFTFLMWRKKGPELEEFTNEAALKVAANRRTGDTGLVALEFDNKAHRFYEISNRE